MGTLQQISALVVGEMWGLRFLNGLLSGRMWGLRFSSTERRLGTIDCSIIGSPSSAYDLQPLYGKINFVLVNAKVSCECRKKLHLPLPTVVLVFSVHSEGKLLSVLDGFVAFEFLRCRKMVAAAI